ncbi:MAG TPA: DUF2336 domain-containing protein [Alphaproteobacteria bacterium]
MASLRDLVRLAQDKTQHSRRVIFENINDLFLSSEGRLSDRERALMVDIMGKLLHDMEMQVRRALAARLAQMDTAPRELLVMLANDQVEVARPILQNSRLLGDPDLIEIIRHRSQEHLLIVALRAPLSAEVTDALVDYGDEHVIEQLLKNQDAVLSRRALEYLVGESQRVDSFQEPLLSRHDLPPELAHRMFWWVSAALRKEILSRFTVDSILLDDCLQESARAAIAEATGRREDHVRRLIDGLVEANALDYRFLVQALRSGKVSIFIGGLSHLARLDPVIVRRAVFDPGGESLAIIARATGADRNVFGSLFLLSRQGQAMPSGMRPRKLEEALRFFDSLTPDQARAALRFWRADTEYHRAIAAMEGGT